MGLKQKYPKWLGNCHEAMNAPPCLGGKMAAALAIFLGGASGRTVRGDERHREMLRHGGVCVTRCDCAHDTATNLVDGANQSKIS